MSEAPLLDPEAVRLILHAAFDLSAGPGAVLDAEKAVEAVMELARPMPTYKQLAAAIVPHYPHPVFGCECTPELADGTKEVLDQDWSEHVANVVLARLNGSES